VCYAHSAQCTALGVDQKRALVKDITEAMVKHFKVEPESVTIDIIEYSRENLANGGKLFVDG